MKLLKKRYADPNNVHPLLNRPVSEETRRKMSESAKKRKSNSMTTKEELLNLAKQCKSQREMAKNLNCTPALISYLIKSWNIKEEVQNLLKQKITT